MKWGCMCRIMGPPDVCTFPNVFPSAPCVHSPTATQPASLMLLFGQTVQRSTLTLQMMCVGRAFRLLGQQPAAPGVPQEPCRPHSRTLHPAPLARKTPSLQDILKLSLPVPVARGRWTGKRKQQCSLRNC